MTADGKTFFPVGLIFFSFYLKSSYFITIMFRLNILQPMAPVAQTE